MIWKTIKGHTNFQISDTGLIRQIRGIANGPRPVSSPKGIVLLHNDDGDPAKLKVAALMMTVFGRVWEWTPKPVKLLEPGEPVKVREKPGPHGKLTPDAIREIRATTRQTKALCEKFGVQRSAIKKARSGDTWVDVV